MSADELASAIEDRRTELGLYWEELADKAGVTYETLRSIRKGRRMRALTRARLERALEWETGYIRAMLDDPPRPFDFLDPTELKMWRQVFTPPDVREREILERRQQLRQTGQ